MIASKEKTRTHAREAGESKSIVWGAVGLFVGLAGILLILVTGDSIGKLPLREASTIGVLVGILVYFLLCMQNLRGAWSTTSMAFLILFFFHAGLFIEYALSGGLSDTFEFHQEWMLSPIAQNVIAIVMAAFFAFLFGSSIPSLLRGWGPFKNRENSSSPLLLTDEKDAVFRGVTARVGALMVIGGVLFWFYENISRDGLLFFTLGYRNFFTSSRDLDTSATVLPILLGLGFVAQSVRPIASKVALLLFSAYSVISLIVGARIYPMSGVVIFLVVLALRKRMPSSWWLFGGITGALTIISLIRSYRNEGIVGLEGNAVLVDPAGSLAELGSTVKVVAVSYLWHEENNESYSMGMTFLNPFVRGFNTLFGIANLPAEADPGSFVNVIASREGQIGGSIVAEAHLNWGILGVIIVLAIWGFALSATSAMSRTSLTMSVTALLLVLFLIQVRGFFGPIPALTVVGSAIILVTRLIARAWQRRIASRAPAAGEASASLDRVDR